MKGAHRESRELQDRRESRGRLGHKGRKGEPVPQGREADRAILGRVDPQAQMDERGRKGHKGIRVMTVRLGL